MIHKFDPSKQLIVVKARIVGPVGDLMVHLALDTGASSTLIDWEALAFVGYEKDHAFGHVQMTTGSATELVPRIKLKQLAALGRRRRNVGIIAHTLPTGASVDGLLGLDFLCKLRLTVDFRKNTITLV